MRQVKQLELAAEATREDKERAAAEMGRLRTHIAQLEDRLSATAAAGSGAEGQLKQAEGHKQV